MKKFISILTVLFCILAFSGCSSKTAPETEIAEGVEFRMLDVVEITNETTNTTYFYYLASLNNNSQERYHVADLHIDLAEKNGDDISKISSMDKEQSTIATDLEAGQSSFVYGYYGFPASDVKNPGLSLGADHFVSFNSVKVRSIKDQNIVNSTEDKFVIYDDEFFEFEVDASKVQYSYKNGVSVVSGLVLTYKNKTDQQLVVPYLKPVCVIDGLELGNYPDPNKLKAMTVDELKKQDFKTNGMAPRTSAYTGTALNYQLYYLEAKQEFPCYVTFTFKGIIPDFSNTSGSSGITISINSAPLGYSQRIQVPY